MQEIDKLNSKYQFIMINNISFNIEVDSVKKFKDYKADKKVCDLIAENSHGIKNQLQSILTNRKNYFLYNKEFNEIVEKMKTISLSDNISKIKFYIKLPFVKLKKKRPQLDFHIFINISYTSPAGRNHYERKVYYNYDKIISLNSVIINEFIKNQSNKEIKAQEKLIKCIGCNNFIKEESNYCSFCGKCQMKDIISELIPKVSNKEEFNKDNINVENGIDVIVASEKDNLNNEIIEDNSKIIVEKNIESKQSEDTINSIDNKVIPNTIDKETFSMDNINVENGIDVISASEKDNLNNEITEDNNKKIAEKLKNNIIAKEIIINDYEKSKYQEEVNYINKSSRTISYWKKIKVKLDNCNYIEEEYSSYIDYNDVKVKHLRFEKILEQYFKKKYIGKEIYNYKIIDAYADWFDYSLCKYYNIDVKYIYFACKCKNCGRIIHQITDDFLRNPIKCKCKSKKYIERKQIDIIWECNYLPYMKRVYEKIITEEYYDKNDFGKYYYNVYVSNCFTFYYKYNNELKRAGLSKIREFNAGGNYIIGDVKIPFKSEEIIFNNVYFYLKTNYDYLTDKEYKYLNHPLLFYYSQDKYYDMDVYLRRKKVFEENCVSIDSYVFIFFEKTNLSTKIRESIYRMNIYSDNKLIFQKENIKHVNYKYTKNNETIIFNFNNGCSGKIYQFFIKDKKMKVYDSGYFQSLFYDTNTNINININKIDDNLKKNIQKYNKYDNKKYRKIYIHKNAYEASWILYEYLKENESFEILENEFSDDKNLNYSVLIDRDDDEKNNFINYVLNVSNDYHQSFECNIYEHSISTICRILLQKQENLIKVLNAINNTHILEIEDSEKKENIINFLKRNYMPISTLLSFKNDFYIRKETYYDKIIKKLKHKYNVDDFGLILIFLVKYGEEVVFNLPRYYYDYYSIKNDINNYDMLYNSLLNKSDFKKTKWKSEYNLFLLIKSYFSDAIFQYKCKELENQSLDIYIPSLKIGFEYQGIQHFESNDYFGGEEGFKHRIQLDQRKKEICKKDNIILIEWIYTDEINKFNLDSYLINYKEQLKGKYEFTDI